MIISRDELISTLTNMFGDTPTDEQLKVLDDVSDTFTDFDERITTSGDWKVKYEENDASWRKRYKERFMNPATDGDTIIKEQTQDIIDDGTIRSFDELFKEREG